MVVVLACAGIALRLWQYAVNSSLWLDEAALARNIVDRPLRQLFEPLDYAQVAAPGFLLIEKGIVSVFGTSEPALRLFPLICGIAGIAIFWRIASWSLDEKPAIYATGLFALATPLVYFSAQVKQYSSDVLATLVGLWIAMWLQRESAAGWRAVAAALVLASTAWVSQPALFVIAGAGAGLAIGALREGSSAKSRRLLLIVALCAASCVLAVWHAISSVPTSDRAYLDAYWTSGFMPFPPQSAADLLWPWQRLSWLFGVFATGLRRTNGGLGYPWSHLFVALVVVGFVAIWRDRRDIRLILLLPPLAALAASAFHLYPFTGRVLVFLLPIFLLTAAAGAEQALNTVGQRIQFARPALLAIFVGAPIYATLTALPPERMEHLRPLVAAVAERRQRGDAVYVYHGAAHAFQYYAPRVGASARDATFGTCSTTDLRAYVRDVDRFRGRSRVWILATHLPRQGIELRTITDYLDAIGRRLDTIETRSTPDWVSFNAYAFLYDLSDPVRLRNAGADNFPVRTDTVDERVARWACYGAQAASGRF